jgi:hypothetical protein
MPWPSISPDLTPLDFFLYGLITEMFYKTKVQARVKDFHLIMNAAAYIKNDARGSKLLFEPTKLCTENRGRHFEHVT